MAPVVLFDFAVDVNHNAFAAWQINICRNCAKLLLQVADCCCDNLKVVHLDSPKKTLAELLGHGASIT